MQAVTVIALALAVILLSWRVAVAEQRIHALRTLTLALRSELSNVNGRLCRAERHLQTVVADALAATGREEG